MQAIYISSNQFKVSTDKTEEFLTGRRVRALCGLEYKYSTVHSSTYSSPDTTIILEEDELTSNLSEVHYGIINIGNQGSFPKHSHSGDEGSGGLLSLLVLTDTPSDYVEGSYLRSTTSGVEFTDLNDYYYTESEIDTISGSIQTNIDGKSDTGHLHDNRYYTETELNNGQLDDRYYTESEVDTISGTLQIDIDNKSGINHLHDDRYYTESEIDTISGTLQVNIDSKPETLIDLIDTPSSYDDGKYLISTTSGIDWTTLSGVEGSVWHTGSGVPETPITCSGTDGLYDLSDTNRLSGALTTGKSDLVDDDITTSVTAQIQNNHSFGIDFGEEKGVDHLDVYGYIANGTATGEWQEIGGYDRMTVYGSNDNSTWVQIGNQYIVPPVHEYTAGVSQTFRTRLSFSETKTYRYFKITGDTALYFYSPSRPVSWCEIVVKLDDFDIGVDGDYYLNIDNGDVYKKSNGTWSYETNINGDDAPDTFLGLTDTPTTYSGSVGKYLKTTSSGIVFSDIDSEYWESVDVFLDENYSNDKGLPTQVERGLFKGYSMPIWSTPANQYEELVFRIRVPFRWDGVTNPTFMILVSISATEDIGDKFKFQMEWESKGVSSVIPATTAETLTDEVTVTDGTAYYSYLASASLDATKLIAGDNLQFRVRRVAATDPQVSNEIIVWHWDSRWKMNKLGTVSE